MFTEQRFVSVQAALNEPTFRRLREEALANLHRLEASYIPGHKQGHTLAYEHILRHAPRLLGLYRDTRLHAWLLTLTGTAVEPTPVQDQSSLSILCYQAAGDHIGWHYDHNFYRGRHFTVLLTLVNRGADGRLSHSRLERRLPDGSTEVVHGHENSLVVFEGTKVRHRVTPCDAGDLRVVLSMTFCDDPRTTPVKEAARRVKDVAFFGARALWD